MPLIKSAIKKAKQDIGRTERNRHFKTKMQTMYKNIQKFVTGGEVEKAKSFISEAFSSIDIASKKGLIHKNNAANKKSLLAKLVGGTPSASKKEVKKAPAKKPSAKPVAKKAPAKKPVAKKAPVKTATKKTEKK